MSVGACGGSRRSATTCAVLLTLFSVRAASHEPDGGTAEHHVLETRVEAEAPTSAASAETIRERDLILRPMATPEDILRVVPGLVIAQHQGGGKADQLFLRGFDADHGTDVALFLDGVPVNMPSHGHGQGFADLHFLIPEVIDRIDVRKGPYFAEYGDFDTAGAVNLRTRRSFAESSISASYGSFNSYRLLGIASPRIAEGRPWLAAEVAGTNGPFDDPERLQRYNLIVKETLALNASTIVSILASAYGSSWNASGQIPLRAVESGQLSRFGAIDPTEGGQTQRQMVVVSLEQRSGTDLIGLTAYAVRYRLRLFSDFTLQLFDGQNFDQLEQDDARFFTGINGRFRTTRSIGSMKLVSTLGAQARYDDIHAQLWHTARRERLSSCFDAGDNPCSNALISQTNLGAYLEEDFRIAPWLRIVAGVRGDLFQFNVDDQRGVRAPSAEAQTTGAVQRAIASPKLQIVLRPLPDWDIYLDGGSGFHSNDARGVIAAGGSGAVPRAWGSELGTRLRLFNRLDFAAALWQLHLQSEQVFSADRASTEPSDPTQRLGIDLEARFALLPWLWADGDLNLSRATYTQDRGNGNAVALAPTRTATLGLSALHPDGYKGRIGLRHVGDRPATQDRSLTAQGYTVVDLSLGYRHSFWELGLVIENLFNARWREAQFANDSRLRNPPYNETAPVTDIHFTPGNPINARVTLALYY